MCIVTEEDIRAGKPMSEYCRMRMAVSKLGGFLDYVGTKETYERYITVEPGTPKSEILKKLPSIVTLIGEDGSELELTGEWDCPDYSKNAEGRYTFEFSKKVTGKAQDRYSLLKAYVTIADGSENPAPGEDSGDSQSSGTSEQAPKSGGCGSSAFAGSMAAAAVCGAVVIGRKKETSKKNRLHL